MPRPRSQAAPSIRPHDRARDRCRRGRRCRRAARARRWESPGRPRAAGTDGSRRCGARWLRPTGARKPMRRPCVEAEFGGDRLQHFHIGDAAAIDVVRALQGVDHVQPAARAQRLGREDGGGRRLGIHHRAGVAQQSLEIPLAEGLAGHFGDAVVVRHHVVAPLRRDRPAVGAGHHAAAVELDLQARHLARRIDQWRGGIAPAAQRVEDVVQRRACALCVVHCGHFISPLMTFAPSSSDEASSSFG